MPLLRGAWDGRRGPAPEHLAVAGVAQVTSRNLNRRYTGVPPPFPGRPAPHRARNRRARNRRPWPCLGRRAGTDQAGPL